MSIRKIMIPINGRDRRFAGNGNVVNRYAIRPNMIIVTNTTATRPANPMSSFEIGMVILFISYPQIQQELFGKYQVPYPNHHLELFS